MVGGPPGATVNNQTYSKSMVLKVHAGSGLVRKNMPTNSPGCWAIMKKWLRDTRACGLNHLTMSFDLCAVFFFSHRTNCRANAHMS